MMKRVLALILAVISVISVAGCGGKKKTASSSLPYAINEMNVENIDDLPDWTGDKLNLSVWYAYGPNNLAIGKLKKDDKFHNEIERVSGVVFDEATSFDNAGESPDAKLAKMVASKAWPHIGVQIESSILNVLCEEDKVYDLTDMIPKYMPNYMAIINSHEELKRQYEDKTHYNGRKYAWNGLGDNVFKYLDPEYSLEKYESIRDIPESHMYVWIRDDILTKLHPEARTVEELKKIYVEKGSFTKEEMFDYTIDSMEEFRTLLEQIDALNIVENGKKVWPFYTHTGMDNWDLFALLDSLAGTGTYTGTVSYFTYYDLQQKKIVNGVKQDWFKEYAKFINKLYRDGLASEEAFIDTKAVFDQKKANGEYAILYGLATPPTDEFLKSSGKNYSYRKVFLDVPVDYSRFMNVNTDSIFNDSRDITFFKDKLTETEVEQILRLIDFFYSDAGMKFANWGPKKAGLYEETEDGLLKYTDKAFETAMVYDGDDQVLFDYGFASFPTLEDIMMADGYNKYQPKMMYKNYPQERKPEAYLQAFNSSYVDELPEWPKAKMGWDFWLFPAYVEGVETFMNARQVMEDALKTVVAAKSDEEFEKYYQKLIEIEERNGFDDACFEEINKVFREQNGELYAGIENWKYEK